MTLVIDSFVLYIHITGQDMIETIIHTITNYKGSSVEKKKGSNNPKTKQSNSHNKMEEEKIRSNATFFVYYL